MRMTQATAQRLFGQARVARLATVGAAGEPHLVPVTFVVITAPAVATTASTSAVPEARFAPTMTIVFAIDHKPKTTTAVRRLDNIAVNPRVAFLADRYAEDWEQLWWVRADADATVLDGAPRGRAMTALIRKYAQYEQIPPDGVIVGARVAKWTGWQYADR